LREKILKQTVKEQEGKIRDLKSRLFGKKSEKRIPVKMETHQNHRRPNNLVVSSPEARGMDVQSVPISLKKKNRLTFQKLRHALIAVKPIYPMEVRKQKLLKLKSRRIHAKSYALV